jgi:hypothetical protein
MFELLDPAILREHRLTGADLNPVFLTRLSERVARCGLRGEIVEDDIERTAVQPEPDLLLATLLLEHIDWQCGVKVFAGLRPGACGIILQENPQGMTAAVTPGRCVPPAIARAVETGHPTLVPKEDIAQAMRVQGYVCCANANQDVADGKRLVALLFRRFEADYIA